MVRIKCPMIRAFYCWHKNRKQMQNNRNRKVCNREINGRTIIERNTRLCDRRGGEKRMNYEQLIEELREEMLQLVNTKCDALLQMYRSGEVHTSVKDTIRESSLITVSPAELKGKRPLAVQFAPGEWIETPTWRKVAQRILQTCNEQPDIHERFMEMCGKVAGRWRTILGSSPEEMDVPIKVDEELYFEGKFDTEAMLNMLEKKVLEPAGVDYSLSLIHISEPTRH